MNSDIFVTIKSPECTYPIYLDDEPIENLRDKIFMEFNFQNFLVVINRKVYNLYKKQLGFSKDEIFIVNDGEKEKNFENYEKILKIAGKKRLCRKDAIIAIGGGVVGDLAGFAAATYMRGLNLIHVPTTLLACVDSSIGGKVAVNTELGKNTVGAFYQPTAIFINLNFLKTLDDRQFKTGLAEVLKYAFIEKSCKAEIDYGFFDFISINSKRILRREMQFLEKIIRISIDLKASVICQDEKESGLRKILNFGHTYGHALEKLTNYQKYTHGEAVILGMLFVFNYAFKNNFIERDYIENATQLFKDFGFNNKNVGISNKKIFETMKLDKKACFGRIKFIVPISKGRVLEQDFNPENADF